MKEVGLRDRKKQKTKENIIVFSRKLFNSKGYENTSIEAICEKVEISKATFYNYYPSKDSLFVSMYEDDIEEITKLYNEFPELNDIQKIKLVYTNLLNSAIKYSYLVGMSYLMMLTKPSFEKLIDRLKYILIASIENGIKENYFKDNLTSDEIFVIINGLYYSILIFESSSDYISHFNEIFDKLLIK